jgi:hypothetical protein
MTAKTMTNLAAIKAFFGVDGKTVTSAELKGLSKDDRAELGAMAREELTSA